MDCFNHVCNSTLKIYAIYMHIGDLMLLFVLLLEMCKLKKTALKSLSQDQVLKKSSVKIYSRASSMNWSKYWTENTGSRSSLEITMRMISRYLVDQDEELMMLFR